MVRQLLAIALLCIASVTVAAAPADTRAGIFHPDFSTLQVHADGAPLSDAVMLLDGDSRLVIEFDERASDVRYMRYSLTHCNADWQPSGLIALEYLDGFNEGIVDNYDFSRATTVQYVHYRIELPNDNIRLTRSGNYLLKVYDETDPDAIILQARFRVVEQRVAIGAGVTSRTDIDYNGSRQQLSIEIDAGRIPVHDAFNDFKVVVTQNNRPDNAVTLLHPLRLSGEELIYEHMPELIFPAGNEYRRFETVSTRVPSMRIESVGYTHPYYHAFISPDEPRREAGYAYDSTQQGRYFVRELDASDSSTEADYVVTHFFLSMPEAPGLDIFVEGDLTDRRLDANSRMTYNPELGGYELVRLLKQGSYNYQYVALPRGTSSPALTSTVEGDYYNTVNEYQIAVYHRLPTERADRLVGYFTILAQ